MSELHQFDADFLQELVDARKEGRQLIYSHDSNSSAEISLGRKHLVKTLLERQLVGLRHAGSSSYPTNSYSYVAITHKGITALAERMADEKFASLGQLRYNTDLQEVIETLLEILRDQAQRITELELKS